MADKPKKKFIKDSKPKRVVGLSVDVDTIAYFKNLANQRGLPYQALMNLALREHVKWGLDVEVTSHRDQTEFEV